MLGLNTIEIESEAFNGAKRERKFCNFIIAEMFV